MILLCYMQLICSLKQHTILQFYQAMCVVVQQQGMTRGNEKGNMLSIMPLCASLHISPCPLTGDSQQQCPVVKVKRKYYVNEEMGNPWMG